MAPRKKPLTKSVAHKSVSFINDEAKQFFEEIKSNPFIFERGFIIEERAWSKNYIFQMRTQGWEVLCHPRTEAILPWVYEFYANAKFHNDDVAMVRGKELDFSANAINNYFGLKTDCVDDYSRLLSSLSKEDIAAVLCLSTDDPWTNRSKLVFKASSFTREAKVWLLFVNAGIIPTKNPNNVTMDRAVLIYCILKGSSVNIGRIISDQIRKKISSSTGQQLWFPTLITALCRSAGVFCGAGDTITTVGHHITQNVISAYVKVADHVNLKSRASSSTVPAPPSGLPPDWSIAMKYIHTTAKYQRQQHRHITAYLDLLYHNQLLLLRHSNVPEDKIAFREMNPTGEANTSSGSKGKGVASSHADDDEDDLESEEESGDDDDDYEEGG